MKFKNIQLILVELILLFLISPFLSKSIMAFSETLDQRCRVTSDQMLPKSITNVAYSPQQSFKPSYDHLTKIAVYVNGDGVGKIKLWLIEDWAGGNYYVSSSGEVAEPNGKAMVYFNFDNLEVKPGKSYMILAGATDYSKLEWYYQENCYADGSGHLGDVEQSYDFAFQTYGYSNVVIQEVPISIMPVYKLTTPTPVVIKFPNFIPTKIPTPTPTKIPTLTPTSTTAKVVTPTPDLASITPIPTTGTALPILDENPVIPPPIVEDVYKDLEKIENLEESIDLSNMDEFLLKGTGEKGSKILITLGKNNYEVVVDDNGQWVVKLPLSDIKNGTYKITGQTQINGAGGNIVDLATVRIQKDSKSYPYIIAILIVLIGLTVFGMYLDGKKKKLNIVKEEKQLEETSKIIEESNENSLKTK